MSGHKLVLAQEQFDCPVCLTPGNAPEEGVCLKDCLHVICRDCLQSHISHAQRLPVPCPASPCQEHITEAELASLVSPSIVTKLHEFSLQAAEASMQNTFHCVHSNCRGFYVIDEQFNDFNCNVCGKHNCITCRISHPGKTCKEYQDEIKRKANSVHDSAAKKTLAKLEKMVKSGNAMTCPTCQVYIQKKQGCDWLVCSVCKTEICWATRGPRWGPKGPGDTTGGCKCNLEGKKCHASCSNCH